MSARLGMWTRLTARQPAPSLLPFVAGAYLLFSAFFYYSARREHRLGVATGNSPFSGRELCRDRVGDHGLYTELCVAFTAGRSTGGPLRSQEAADPWSVGIHLRLVSLRVRTESPRPLHRPRATGCRLRHATQFG